jgi:hypothetical protein
MRSPVTPLQGYRLLLIKTRRDHCAVILSAWQAKIAGVNRALRLQSA